ncbi:hypothetical protein [Algirhabdus cladophorae]|uniref:hypothetical protein n=1 Tax=Algirhabdus cladophorae TaxID=3377108 RepID=UPI003B8456A9
MLCAQTGPDPVEIVAEAATMAYEGDGQSAVLIGLGPVQARPDKLRDFLCDPSAVGRSLSKMRYRFSCMSSISMPLPYVPVQPSVSSPPTFD